MNDSDLDPLELVLARAREGLSPSDAQIRRVWVGIPAAGPAPPLGGTASATRPSGSWAAIKGAGKAGWVALSVLMAGSFLAGYWARPVAPNGDAQSSPPMVDGAGVKRALEVGEPSSTRAEPLSPTATSERIPPVRSGVTVPRQASEERSRGEQRPSAPGRKHVPSAPAEAELFLLERIDRALRNENTALALSLLGQLEKDYPDTRLGEERRAARLMADCLAGSAGSEAAAQAFLEAQPASVYASRLRALCKVR